MIAIFLMMLRILIVCFWIFALIGSAAGQPAGPRSRRKTSKPRPASALPPAPSNDSTQNTVVLRQSEPKGWVWVSQTIDLTNQLGGEENIMTLDGEPAPSMQKKRVTLGVVLDADGHILTRLFDVSPANPPKGVMAAASGTRQFPARFLGMDPVTGLCILRAEGAGFTPAQISTQAALPLRQNIRLYGFHPNLNLNNVPGMSFERPRRFAYPGQIAKATTDFRFTETNPIYYLLSPKLAPVQDCSLILEKDDSVFGLAIYDVGSEGRHLVYPISRVQAIAQAVIRTNKSLAFGWLGVTGKDTGSIIPTALSAPPAPEPGVVVTAIAPDSPAEVAGVRPKDVLLGLNDRRIETYAQLATALRQVPPDCEIDIRVRRGAEYRTFRVKLIPAPASEAEQQLFAFTQRLEAMEGELKALPPLDPGRQKLEPRVDMMRNFVGQVTSPAPPDIRLRVLYGLEVQPLTSQLMSFFAVTNGLLVTSVLEKNKAARAGLQAGDVIVKVDDKEVASLANLLVLLDAQTNGSIEITVSRQKQQIKLNFTR